MHIRISFARLLLALSRFIQSLLPAFLSPDALIEFSRQYYSKPLNMVKWWQDKTLNEGLFPREKFLLDRLPVRNGALLLLGLGAGRDAIPLAKAGFKVTGVDYVPELIEKAKVFAQKEQIKLEGLIQDYSNLKVPDHSFDVVWISNAGYSMIPGRKKRVKMLKTIGKALKPGGYLVSQFIQRSLPKNKSAVSHELIKRIFALLTLGNLEYEAGDNLIHDIEFCHIFPSIGKLNEEFFEGGFEVVNSDLFQDKFLCGMILRKPA